MDSEKWGIDYLQQISTILVPASCPIPFTYPVDDDIEATNAASFL